MTIEEWRKFNNPHNIQVGDSVILDGECIVIVLSFTKPHSLYTNVTSDINDKVGWYVMTNRLSPINTPP